MSYQGHSEDKDKVLNALGGKKGLIDSGLPSLVFLIVFNLSGKNITSAIYAAIGLSIVLTFIRIVKRETVQHAFSGLIGVGVCAFIARRSGNAADFYLPGLWINAGYALLYALTNLFGFYNSAGSYYPDLTVNYETGVWGLTLNGHVGYQYISNKVGVYDFSYADYKFGVTKDFGGGLSANVSYVGTDAKSVRGTPLYVSPTGNKNWGKDGYLISLTKTF